MNSIFRRILSILTISYLIILTGCHNYLDRGEHNLKIIIADSINLYEIDPRETENLHQIINVIERNAIDNDGDSAVKAHIFHPIISRLDTKEEFPFKISVESFSGDKNNPKIISKSINELFDKDNLNKIFKPKKRFFLNFNSKKADIIAVENYLLKAKKDSVYFYDENTDSLSIQVGIKKYKIFNDIDLLRLQIRKALDENDKATFIVIMGTPINSISWIATGNEKCKDNVSHYEEKSTIGEVRWVIGGKLKCPPPIITRVSSKKTTANLPKELNTQDVKIEDVIDRNVKDVVPNSKKKSQL